MYKTKQGDTWDLISFRVYGVETAIDKLMSANSKHKDIEIFPDGVEIEVPQIDSEELKNNSNLPPWKRNRS